MTPNQLEKLPLGLSEIYLDLEEDILKEIIKGIKRTGKIEEKTAYLLEREKMLSQSGKEVKKRIGLALNLSKKEVDSMFLDMVQYDYADTKDLYTRSGIDFVPYSSNKVLQQQIEAITVLTNKELANITNTIGFISESRFIGFTDYYRKMLDKTNIAITTGSYSYDDALKKTVKQFLKSGIRTIDYASGKVDKVEVATRRAVMTSVTQMSQAIQVKNGTDLGVEKYEVSAHAGARNTGEGYLNHRGWQGKVYTMQELQEICGLGLGGGLGGWNCRHSFYPFIDGLSKRAYSDKDLREMYKKEDETITFGGKEFNTYQATQEQRRLEVQMRNARMNSNLLKESGASGTEEKARYQAIKQQYYAFSQKAGLQPQIRRVTIV